MAGSRIKGITVEIGGDTTKLQTALQELKRLEEAANQSATAVQRVAATGEKLKTVGDNISNILASSC